MARSCLTCVSISSALAASSWREHRLDLVEREPGRLSQRDQGELIQDAWREAAPRACRTHRRNEAAPLVVPQCRRGDAGAPRDFRNVHDGRMSLT